ncbi:hypothetical protein [Streptomyces sp. ME19-01-6]|uniref:hypothetical protein n=1 Tax=Streptomyces sp. ME19-01-6 TaxID=3028686 RepID=UPI0029A7B61D|nr:hypothetical protein [Streptomyces sp. ME19-01-6]MDX3225049.1 hypothetical protein [Streptomyces sp. ME19-01-6]
MSYRLDAVISDFDRLRSWAEGVPGAVVAPLAQRMGLLMLPTGLRGELPRTLRDLSQGGPVAHVEANFWGGDGHQTAALWRAGVPAHRTTEICLWKWVSVKDGTRRTGAGPL